MRCFLFFSFLFFSFNLFSQKEDFTWISGKGSGTTGFFGGMRISFHGANPEVRKVAPAGKFAETNASICSPDGKLLVYTHGTAVYDSLQQKMTIDGEFNPGNQTNGFLGSGLRTQQGALILPFPGRDSMSMIFHMSSNDFFYSDLIVFLANGLRTTLFNANGNQGRGSLEQMNQLVFSDSLRTGFLSATQHGNGRDWWVVSRAGYSTTTFVSLLDTSGVRLVHKYAYTPFEYDVEYKSVVGQGCFSPDGTLYVQLIQKNFYNLSVYVSDFNPCTGELSNDRYFELEIDPSFAGASISPNSRYLYVSSAAKVWQLDLWAHDLLSSQIEVGKRDTLVGGPFQVPLGYLLHQLGPDGRIYISTDAQSEFWHVIEYPDEPGAACFVHNRGLALPIWSSWTMPNFPFYRSGAAEGSACDSLGIRHAVAAKWRWKEWDTRQVRFTDVSYYKPEAWLWDFGDGRQSTDRHPYHTYDETGDYYVCLTVSNTGGSDQFCDTVRVQNLPVAEWLYRDFAPSAYAFIDSSYWDISTWYWDFGDGGTASTKDAIHTYTETGRYEVCLTVENAQGSDSRCRWLDVLVTGVEEVEKAKGGFWIYPNPADQKVVIQCTDAQSEMSSIRITDLTGKEVMQQVLNRKVSMLELNVQSLAKGVYIVVVTTRDGQPSAHKLMVD